MFEYFESALKGAVVESLSEIVDTMKFKNPEKVFPVLQLLYRKMGKEETAPESLQHISKTITPVVAEGLVYLLKSENEYFLLSLSFNGDEITTDGKPLGKFHEDMLKRISPNIPMISVAYGNPEYSIDFTSANIKKLFFNPLDIQDEYCMDYSSQFCKENFNEFIKENAYRLNSAYYQM